MNRARNTQYSIAFPTAVSSWVTRGWNTRICPAEGSFSCLFQRLAVCNSSPNSLSRFFQRLGGLYVFYFVFVFFFFDFRFFSLTKKCGRIFFGSFFLSKKSKFSIFEKFDFFSRFSTFFDFSTFSIFLDFSIFFGRENFSTKIFSTKIFRVEKF